MNLIHDTAVNELRYLRQSRRESERFDAYYFTEVGRGSPPVIVDYSGDEAVTFTESQAADLPHLAAVLARLRERILAPNDADDANWVNFLPDESFTPQDQRLGMEFAQNCFNQMRKSRKGSERFSEHYYTEVGQVQHTITQSINNLLSSSPTEPVTGHCILPPVIVDYSGDDAVTFTESQAAGLPHLAAVLARLRERIAQPPMLSFQITALGFNGADDATDDHTFKLWRQSNLWVLAHRSDLDSALEGQPYSVANQLPFDLSREQTDFVLPEQGICYQNAEF